MRTQSTIITTLAVTAALALPGAAASGSPLLSGYGSPGAGEQQLVGGGLVGGGGSGSSGGGGSTSATPASSTQASSAAQGHSSLGKAAGGGTAGQSRGGGTAGGGGAGSASSGSAHRGGRSSDATGSGSTHAAAAAQATVAVPSSTLGLSGGQLLLAAVLAMSLLLSALATRWLAGLKLGKESADRRIMNAGKGH